MANDFYNASGWPTTHAAGSSASARAEFAAIAAGFDLLPTVTGNALKYVRVNSGGTGLEAVAAIDSVTIGGVTPGAGTFTTLTTTGDVTVGSDTVSVAPASGHAYYDASAVAGSAAYVRLAGGGTTLGTTSFDITCDTSGNGNLLARTGSLYFGSANTYRAYLDGAGDLLPYADNTYALGNASKRWSLLYVRKARVEAPASTDGEIIVVGNGDSGDTWGTMLRSNYSDHAGELATRNATPLRLMTNLTTRITINSTGNTTISPPASGINLTLDSTLPTGAGVATAQLYLVNTGTNGVRLAYALSNSHVYISSGGSTTDPDIIFGTNDGAQETLRISSDGGVIIAAPTTGYGLNIPTGTPASAAAAGDAGDIAWDASYVYVCTAASTWKRAAITTW